MFAGLLHAMFTEVMANEREVGLEVKEATCHDMVDAAQKLGLIAEEEAESLAQFAHAAALSPYDGKLLH